MYSILTGNPATQEGVKGGGTFLAGKTNLADDEAVQRLAEAFKSGEMTNEINMHDLSSEPVVIRGQTRIFRKTGRRMMGIMDKELVAVKKTVKEAVRKAGGNPSLIMKSLVCRSNGRG
ncbi:hypothetical protein CYMTET_25793 [Cymbomonas tetramitiformis]|uniref:Uncharacterized protein n=1 Tax=Cymbomonas tetramitiformis TaxID=36881 RepID=A0AAE0KYK4_9CHLO|nr:hypothetical protein CYMTET_25793 [Cymbomonas tetramitiformis]